MSNRLELHVYAPIPVGHRVSILYLERWLPHLLGSGGDWSKWEHVLVCDESTRVIYTDREVGLDFESTYEKILFSTEHVRISTIDPAVRGTVVSCLALCDHGGNTRLRTVLGIEHA